MVMGVAADGTLVSQDIPPLYECPRMDFCHRWSVCSVSPVFFWIMFDMSRYERPDHRGVGACWSCLLLRIESDKRTFHSTTCPLPLPSLSLLVSPCPDPYPFCSASNSATRSLSLRDFVSTLSVAWYVAPLGAPFEGFLGTAVRWLVAVA